MSHTTQKVLKIYLKFTAAHQFLHARYFLFWYLMLFTSFSNEKKNPFHSKRNSRWYILGWMCWQKRHGNIQQQQEATNCITQPYFLHIWNSYLHELFSFCAGSCCRFFSGSIFFHTQSIIFPRGLRMGIWEKQTNWDRTYEIRVKWKGFFACVRLISKLHIQSSHNLHCIMPANRN